MSQREPVDAATIRIGISPDASATVARREDLPGRANVLDVPAVPKQVSWQEYLAWRKTKCKPRNLDRNVLGADMEVDAWREAWAGQEWLEEIDQATHEVVGEAAELAELVFEKGPYCFYGEGRDKLIDECGDIIFCASWAMDAWGENPLGDAEDDQTELVFLPEDEMAQVIGGELRLRTVKEVCQDGELLSALLMHATHQLLVASTAIGLTANAFKKLKYQRRAQEDGAQCARLSVALVAVNVLLILAGATMQDAIRSNMKKLDARYPEGYKPGVGGGIRTGEGR